MAKYQRRQRSSAGWKTHPATDAQYAMVEQIAQEHIVDLALLNEYERQKAAGLITKGSITSWKEMFEAQPPLPLSEEEQHATEPGFYELNGERYEAKFNRKTGRLNVFSVRTGEYAKGIAPQLKRKHFSFDQSKVEAGAA